MKNWLFFLFSVVLFCGVASAQDSRGSISGRVLDSGASPVANAEVVARNTSTGVAASSRTNESGVYTIPYLIPGPYQVTVEYTGFKRHLQNVEVRVNDALQLEITLQVGDVAEQVEVKAETPLLSTGEASVGQVIDERRIQELPLFAGNAMDLVHLAPGVTNGTNLRLRKAPFNNAPSQFGTNGGANYQNEFTIDGVSNTYSDGTQPRVAFSPPQTAISEFKVQTTQFDATLGNTMGSVVNVNTKGGTNQFRGEVHWWLRHSMFDAPTIFQNRANQKIALYQDNRYGASGGSPIIIPKVYNGRNRTFWFFAFEGNKFGDPNVGQITGTVPTEAQRRGDLSSWLRLGSNYQIYDPFSTRPGPTAGTFVRDPIPGNIIPQNRLNPVALRMLQYWPMPNQVSTNAEGRNNYFFSGKAIEDYWTTIGRVDHAFSDRHRMFFRLHRDYWQEDKNRLFRGDPITGIILNRVNRGFALDDVLVLTPSLLLNLRYGITAQEFPEQRVSRGFDLASLGFASSLTSRVPAELATFPRTAVAPFTTLSNWESGDGSTSSLIHNPVVALTWLKGKHSMRFGGDFRNIRENRNRFPADTSPDLSFNANFTRATNTSNNPQLGGEFAAFLMGIPAGSMTQSASYAEQNTIYGFYFQDDFKVSSRLTLNFGLRYEYETAIQERYNRSVYGFAANEANPIQAAAQARYALNPITEIPASQFRVLGGLTFAGVNGNPRRLWDADPNNFMPRFGFAYQLFSKTVIRGGYGVFYGPIGTLYTNSVQTGFSQSTPIQASLDNGLTFPASLTNPFPTGLIAPSGANNGLRTNLGQGLTYFDSSRRNPYAQRWSFGMQHEIFRTVIEATYVGNRGSDLNIQRNINATPNQYLSQDSYLRDNTRINYLNQAIPNPFNTLDPIYGVNITRANLLRPYPHFGDINVIEPLGTASYHALQVRVERRFAQGFSIQSSYTWSKAMEATEFLNPADITPYSTVSAGDRTHRIVGSAVWELPIGRGRKYISDVPKALDLFVGGWQLNGMMQHQSGQPLGFGNRIFLGDLKNVVAEDKSVDRWFNTLPGNALEPGPFPTRAGFVAQAGQQLASNVRTFPLRFNGIRGPVQDRWDFSLLKNFVIRENWRMQFRAECYNALNFPNLANPNTDPTSAAFGQITSQDPPRSWQFALKMTF